MRSSIASSRARSAPRPSSPIRRSSPRSARRVELNPPLRLYCRPPMRKFLAALLVVCPASAFAQTTYTVSTQSALQTAIGAAASGDTIVLAADVTLTSALPTIGVDITIDGAGHTLDGAGQFRGLVVGAVG